MSSRNFLFGLIITFCIFSTACQKKPRHMTVEEVKALESELVSDPARLKKIGEQCRYDRESVGEQACIAVAGARRQLFMTPKRNTH